MKTGVVSLSGGQDSVTSLYWAKAKFARVVAINVDYGQRHARELEAAKKVAELAGVELYRLSFEAFSQLSNSAMLAVARAVSVSATRADGLPATFVPGRNLVLGILAAALASGQRSEDVVLGVCQTDFSGYPDCRRDTMDALETTVRLGMGMPGFTIHTPLMHLTKAQTVKLARQLPGCWEALRYSHTCYAGSHPPCGECPACKLRARGFAEAGEIDPICG